MGKSEKSSKKDSLVTEVPSGNAGLPPGWTRYTILIRTEHLDKLKAFAFWTQIPIKAALEAVFDKFFSSRTIRPIPTAEDDLKSQLFEEIKKNKL